MNGYFRIVVKSFIVLCVVFAAGVRGAGDYAPEPPPRFDKGWNLVSVPCDISIGDFKRDMKEDSLKVYGWNGAGYEETESLERGRGYFINVKSVLNPSAVCKPKAANEDMKVVFKPGWNLIGNPYHKAATFTQLLGGAAEKEDTAIFELKGDKAIPVKPTAQAKPWRGYWLYVTPGAAMPIVNKYLLEVRAYRDSARTRETVYPVGVLMGEELYFSAIVTTQEGPANAETKDVTADAAWTAAGEEIGLFSTGAKFISTATGSATVSAEYSGLVSNLVAVNGKEPQPPEGNICVDGSAPEKGACPDVWFYIQPIQCGWNPWETGFEQPYPDESYPYTEEPNVQRMKDFYRIKHNIEIKDVRICYSPGDTAVCCACSCEWGGIRSFLVSNADAVTLKNNDLYYQLNKYSLNIGNIILDVVSAEKEPSACLNVACGGDSDCKNNESGEKGYCISAGTSGARCDYGYSVSECACKIDYDCFDSNSTTEDKCAQPADDAPYCAYTNCVMACKSDYPDCDDGNASTVDRCQYSSSCDSFCLHWTPAQNPKLIRLKYAEFDPLVAEPRIEPMFNQSQTSEINKKLYIVQFNGKISEDDQTYAREISAFDYIPDDAYLMRLNEADISKLKTALSIRAIVEFRLPYKINSYYIDSFFGKQSEIAAFTVITVDGAESEMAAIVAKLGGKSECKSGRVCGVFVPNCKLMELLRSDTIEYAEPYVY